MYYSNAANLVKNIKSTNSIEYILFIFILVDEFLLLKNLDDSDIPPTRIYCNTFPKLLINF